MFRLCLCSFGALLAAAGLAAAQTSPLFDKDQFIPSKTAVHKIPSTFAFPGVTSTAQPQALGLAANPNVVTPPAVLGGVSQLTRNLTQGGPTIDPSQFQPGADRAKIPASFKLPDTLTQPISPAMLMPRQDIPALDRRFK